MKILINIQHNYITYISIILHSVELGRTSELIYICQMCIGQLCKRVELKVDSWESCILKSCLSSGEDDDDGDNEEKKERKRIILPNTNEFTVCQTFC